MPLLDHLPRVASLPAEILDAPDSVAAGLADAREAGHAYESALAEKAAADTAITQAEAADDAADRAAIAAGKELPQQSATDKAREAAALAARRVEATERVYRERFDVLTAAIVEHREAWAATLKSQLGHKQEAMHDALAAFARARAEHGFVRGTLEALEPFTEDFSRPWYGGGFPSTDRVERVAGGPEFIREDVMRLIRGSRRFSITEDQVDRVLVELELIGANRRPWADTIRGNVENAIEQW